MNLTPEQIRSEFEQSDNIAETLSKYVEDADFYIETLTYAYEKAQVLRNRYPELRDFNPVVAEVSLTANAGDAACRAAYDTEISKCKTMAVTGAIGCGWWAATGVGALACGAGVITVRAICGYYADQQFSNCVMHSSQ